jgi:glycosyltransferase 2 family protein
VEAKPIVMKNTLIAIIKVAVTALLFVYIFRRIDFHQFSITMRNARLDILLAGFIVLWLGHYMCIFRWRLLMRPLMQVPSLNNLFGIYCIGMFFNLAFPTVIGGDVVKMYYAGKPSKAYAQSFAATFLDRDAGMLAMMIIACAVIAIHPVLVPRIPVSIIIWGVFAAFILGNIAIFAPSCHRRLTDLLQFLRLPKIAHKIDLISNAFQLSGKHPAALLISLLISLVNQVLVITVTWIFALGLRIHAPLSIFMIFVPVITLISMIPISLNGMGLREYAFMSLFSSIGIPLASCIALGLLSSIVTILSSLPGGVVYIFFRNKSDAQQLAQFETEFS